MTEKEKLKLESEELNRLVQTGITFEVKETEIRTKTRLFGLIKKHYQVEVLHTYKIDEPTLGTLDRLSAEWVQMAIDENALQGTDALQAVKTMARDNAIRCAKVIAIAVLGSSYNYTKVEPNGVIRSCKDDERLAYLTDLFAREIKPSQLYQLTVAINAISNLGDFSNSIRLMCAARTTNRIEENNLD